MGTRVQETEERIYRILCDQTPVTFMKFGFSDRVSPAYRIVGEAVEDDNLAWRYVAEIANNKRLLQRRGWRVTRGTHSFTYEAYGRIHTTEFPTLTFQRYK